MFTRKILGNEVKIKHIYNICKHINYSQIPFSKIKFTKVSEVKHELRDGEFYDDNNDDNIHKCEA